MREEFAALLFFFGISMTANVAFAIAAFRSARRIRKLESRLVDPVVQDEGRMDSFDQRLEQLARGQEFLSKLVSERRHLPAKREREATPA